jgi:hypothetical protein
MPWNEGVSMRITTPESYGNADAMETLEIQKPIPNVPTASWKSRESSEIPTFPQLLRLVIASQPNNPG